MKHHFILNWNDTMNLFFVYSQNKALRPYLGYVSCIRLQCHVLISP